MNAYDYVTGSTGGKATNKIPLGSTLQCADGRIMVVERSNGYVISGVNAAKLTEMMSIDLRSETAQIVTLTEEPQPDPTPTAPAPAALPADDTEDDDYQPVDKMCAQCGDVFTPAGDETICLSCEADNVAIEALAPEWDDLSTWEKYADPFELRLTETTYAGHPLLTWDHIKVWKGRKVGKVPHAIGLSKARAIVDYHADVYLFATTAGDDEVLPHNKTNSKRNDVPHIDTFKGNKVLHLPCKGKPFSFGLKMAVIYAQYYDQIREFCQRHWRTDPEAAAQAEPTISAAEVGAIVETWLIDSIKRMTPMLPAGNVTNLVENENCGECGLPAARTRADGTVFGGSLYHGRLLCPDCHEPFESGLSKRSQPTPPALDTSFTGKAAQLNMFESVQLNLFPAVPASTDALPMTSTTDLRGAAETAPTIQPDDEDGEPLPMTCCLLAPGEYAYTIRGHFTGLTRRSADQWEVSNPPAGFNKVYESKQAFEQAIQPYLAAPPDPRPSADELSRRASLPEYDEAQRRRDISLCADCGEFTCVDPDETGDLHCGCTEPETETPTTIEAEEQPMDINAYRRELISKAQQRLAAGKPLQYRTYYKVGPIHEVKADSDSRLRYKSGSKWYADAGDQILDQIARQLGMTTAWDYAHPAEPEPPILNPTSGQCIVCKRAVMYRVHDRCEECIDVYWVETPPLAARIAAEILERAKQKIAEEDARAALLAEPAPTPDPAKVEAYEERRAARIERLHRRAQRMSSEAHAMRERAYKMVENIPFGQPILVGHYSEKRDRNLRNRSWTLMGKGIRLGEQAEAAARRADAAENSTAISSDDPLAIQKLQEKIDGLKIAHQQQKAANKAYRKMTEDERAVFLREKCGYNDANIAYMKRRTTVYNLAYTTAEIRRCEDRIAQLKAQAKRTDKETELDGLRIVENADENRLQLFFDGKPDAETIKELKMRGFRWSPSAKAWQRHLNGTAQYAAECIAKHWQERQQ
jgi:hypothetical protein